MAQPFRKKQVQMPEMDDVVSASVMKGAQAPTPQIRGAKSFRTLKGPATPQKGGGVEGGGRVSTDPRDQQQQMIAEMYRKMSGSGKGR
jgi:hypothetical protein